MQASHWSNSTCSSGRWPQWVGDGALGRAYAGREVLYAIAKAGVRAGLPLTVNVHMLRHSVATAMIEDGLADKAVAQILGHADPRVVALYTHPSDEYKAAAIERHGERFRSLLAVGDESPETY